MEEIHRDMDMHPTVGPPHGSLDEENAGTYSSQRRHKNFMPNSYDLPSSNKADSYQIVNQGNNTPHRDTCSSYIYRNIPEKDDDNMRKTISNRQR